MAKITATSIGFCMQRLQEGLACATTTTHHPTMAQSPAPPPKAPFLESSGEEGPEKFTTDGTFYYTYGTP